MDLTDLMRMAGAERDTERFARMSMEERLQLFLELCELAGSVARGRPDAERLLSGTPRSAESEALWRRLMSTGRSGPAGRGTPPAGRGAPPDGSRGR